MYRRKKRSYARLGAPQGLGDVGDIVSAIGTASNVVRDAYFNEVVCEMNQLHAVKTGAPVGVCAETPPQPSTSGLDKVAQALRAYVYAERNPIVYPLAVVALVGLPLWVGYQLGKPSRKSTP